MTEAPKRETLAARTAHTVSRHTVLLTQKRRMQLRFYGGPSVSAGVNAMLRAIFDPPAEQPDKL